MERKHVLLALFALPGLFLFGQEKQVAVQQEMSRATGKWELYPFTYKEQPGLASPFRFDDGTEAVVAVTKEGEFGIVPVTVENGSPLLYSRKIKSLMGKDRQLEVDKGDFPVLAATGIHSESDLDNKEMITGFPVHVITVIGRPNGFSTSGFMAADEDIISVLKGDNRLVRSMGLTHPEMAKPLFHLWNIILKEIEVGKWARFYDHIPFVIYNSRQLSFRANGTKGWQYSIFQDEIQGSFDFEISRELTVEERTFLDEKYRHLTPQQREEMVKKLSSFHFSEMNPYYIMRYGFYEGHVDYRCDPVAIAFIFGLRNLEEIDYAFGGNLHQVLTRHFLPD